MTVSIRNGVPPLATGDRLTKQEFLRRWEAHPEIKDAELIRGVVHMSSPVSIEHGELSADTGAWLGFYKAATAGTACGHKSTMFLPDDILQPDIYLRILTECGGKAWELDGYLHDGPELVIEICLSKVSQDLYAKLDVYENTKVDEYLAILLFERQIRWHILVNGHYEVMPAHADGLWRSKVFPGLWLDGKALLTGDLRQVLAKLQGGLKSAPHQQFVADLRSRSTGTNGNSSCP